MALTLSIRVIYLSTERGIKRRRLSEIDFEHLGIDEKSFKKGRNYVSALSHPSSGCVLKVEEDRSNVSCKLLLKKSLTQSGQEQVTTIGMDMRQAFMSTSKQMLPNAGIAHDRFHLVKDLNDVIDKVRRREVKQHEELKDSRYALLKNPTNLTEKHNDKI